MYRPRARVRGNSDSKKKLQLFEKNTSLNLRKIVHSCKCDTHPI